MKKNIQTENLILHGISAGTGIVYADVCFFSQPESYTFECSINEEGIENELNRYRRALISCKDDLLLLQKRFEKDGTMIGSQILELQLAMLSDPLMNELMEEKIRKLKKNTETVFRLFIQDYKRKFQKIKDPVFVDRIKDIVDVSDRIIRHLNPYSRKKNLQIKKNTILIAEDLLPSDLAEIGAENILGIITNKGGFTSHIAIIARAKGIPYVTNIDVRLLKELGISKVIIDGKVGKVIVNPSPDVIQQYSIENEKIQGIYQELLKKTNLLSETQDQRQIKLFGNLETFQDIDFLIEQNATGIGLFRSEYLFFNHQRIPTEEEQFEVYQKIAIQLQKRPFVIRIFDLSAEKSQLDLDEMNPSLGCRGVRYLLKEKLILENQIRAVLRASAYGEIRILIPFVADLLEVLEVKKVIEEVKLELKKEKIPFNENILVGCMIEIPSAAIMADMIAKEVDFMSIGTNDLAQYTLAADRTSLYASHFFTTVHPSVLRIIKIIIEAAQKENTPLTLCGEMASDTQSLEILIGMGITAFSISPRAIPSVKYEIRKMHYEKLKGLVDQALLVR